MAFARDHRAAFKRGFNAASTVARVFHRLHGESFSLRKASGKTLRGAAEDILLLRRAKHALPAAAPTRLAKDNYWYRLDDSPNWHSRQR